MMKDMFELRKKDLICQVQNQLEKENLTTEQIRSLNKVLKILGEYSYENRLFKKGVLVYTIVDSLHLDSSLGSKLIQFDGCIS